MDPSDARNFESLISTIISQHVNADAFAWLQEKAFAIRGEKASSQLNMAFAAIARKTGKDTIELTENERRRVDSIYSGFSINQWSTDRLCRLWLLTQVDDADNKAYYNKIESLFKAAEVNELVALYSSLITFKYPEEWRLRCAEGIRSNIGTVLEAIMYENPYPHVYLDEPAWNQLVLKAFFTEKDVNRIVGLDERANTKLSSVLVDYAHERWAAHRSVNPLLWRLVSKFIDENNFSDITRLYENGDLREKKAALLACYYSHHKPAKRLVDENPELRSAIMDNKLRWDTV